jgi:hypothetical protein
LEAMQNEWKRKNQCQFFKIHRTWIFEKNEATKDCKTIRS